MRGLIVMALSNKFGWLPLATGNKSELSVGYATLYGDMAGGFALLKDVYKTDVYRLSRHLNERAERELIPSSVLERAPSAELRPDQKDEDSLPPYSELDEVLEAYVELDSSREELTSDGFDPDVVERALAMIDRAEYKRRQAPPGCEAAPEGLRPRPPRPDHEPLARLSLRASRARLINRGTPSHHPLSSVAPEKRARGARNVRERARGVPKVSAAEVLGQAREPREPLLVRHRRVRG